MNLELMQENLKEQLKNMDPADAKRLLRFMVETNQPSGIELFLLSKNCLSDEFLQNLVKRDTSFLLKTAALFPKLAYQS